MAKTECSPVQVVFEGFGSRKLVASFDGEHITSEGGLPLLADVDRRTGLLKKFAACFKDLRDPELVQHTVEELLRQRVFALCCGYEDLNDHHSLRNDPLLAAVVGKELGGEQARLASPSTLNRLELTPADATEKARYKKVVYEGEAIEQFFVTAFLQAHPEPPEEVVLDLDATDDPLHGTQEGRFFHGYYGHYCYLPLYLFAGDFLLCAKLRTANRDAAAGSLEEVQRILKELKARWPKTRFTLRADSGFARDYLLSWCEEQGVDYVFGLAKNSRLEALVVEELRQVKEEAAQKQEAVRKFKELRYRTLDSWSRERRVVAKAEQVGDKSNPRFVVTSLPVERYEARALYEDLYCARGDMENRIKEQQLDLFADRTSSHTLRANQLRLWFSAVAYTLLNLLRHKGLAGTELERAQVGTIRTKLLKLGALVKVSVRRVVLSFSAAAPVQALFARVVELLAHRLPLPS